VVAGAGSNDGGLLLLLPGMLLSRLCSIVQVTISRRAGKAGIASVVLNSRRLLVLLVIQALLQGVLTNNLLPLPDIIFFLLGFVRETTTALGPPRSQATSGSVLWRCAREWRGG
jgi:hypothetical protein